ncbi:MAG: glycosyltransferase, partial [Pedobacter sp.]
MKSLAVIISHPIQYYVPLFKLLAQHYNLKVFYTWGEDGGSTKYDPGFKKTIAWDLPLLEDYEYEFLVNTAKDPGSQHYKGIVNPGLNNAIETFTPDFILIYGWAYQSHLSALRYFKGKIPVLFRGDSTLLDEQKGIKAILRSLFLKWVYQHIDQALYVGTESKKYFKRFGLQEHQLIFAPHAIDNERFARDRSEEALTIRKSLGISTDEILILFAGKLERKKNPELLLEGFIELCTSVADRPSLLEGQKTKHEKQTKLHLLFVGNGELEESLKSRVESFKLQRSFGSRRSRDRFASDVNPIAIGSEQVIDDELCRTHFMDFQNQTQMPAVYQACDLFCLPSQGPGETWGLAVNEAMACGKAVLVSDKVG